MNPTQALVPEQLAHRCDPAKLGFASTAELEDRGDVIGQSRASEAVRFGIAIERQGYNLYVMGRAGSGKHTMVRRAVEERAQGAPRPPDWVYVNNFAQPHQPLAIELPPGKAAQLREDMKRLIEELRANIPAVFESDEYRNRLDGVDAEFKERQEHAFTSLGEEAAAQHVAFLRTPAGFSFAPLKEGEVMSAEDFGRLPQSDQQKIEATIGALQSKLEKIVRDVMRWRKERFERVRELNREITLLAVGHAVDELKARYADLPRVVQYLDAVQRDVTDNADDFRKTQDEASPLQRLMQHEEPSLRRYEVNVLVDHGNPDGSPVVYENHPTFHKLIGRIDHIAQLGTLLTDFGQIKPGALHRANGGYLLLDAPKLLSQPFAWETLKRALSRREIRVESPGEAYSLISTVSLEPEPIPLKVKVILLGERWLFHLLQTYDPEFGELFRVAADFEEEFERSDENVVSFARFLASCAKRDGLLPLASEAVARVVDFGARAAGDSKKITADMQQVMDLVNEADHYAREQKRAAIGADDVLRSIEARKRRSDRLRSRLNEAILRGQLLIDTDGARVGQVNGLSVYVLGDYAFAEPTRITATTRVGDGHVIDIQREVQLGGAIHSKGVMILSSFLAARYSGRQPLSLAASLAFEQTYGMVDGDSASLAETCALLSSLADVPLGQWLGVTGSINQNGEVQPIGGVNEKIEGFFDICRERGLSGKQGVLIPAANLEHLMLKDEVVAAARAGQFHIYAVRTVDEAIELLTGVPAGAPEAAGADVHAAVNARVAARLQAYATTRRAQPRPARIGRARNVRGGRNDR